MAVDTEQNIHQALKDHFGLTSFRFGQEEAIQAILNGRDAIVVMPTGSGKSLCFQLAALLLDGVTIVISPLIALMKDQVDALVARNIPATYINSSLSLDEMSQRMNGIRNGEYKLVYLAPERFRNQRFNRMFEQLDIAMIAVDEAHCISQWGHDFRPDYLRLKYPLKRLTHARVMALTATATPDVREDIIAQMDLGNGNRQPPEIMVHGFSRPNLQLSVTRVRSHDDKLHECLSIIKDYPTGIIYCATRKNTERVSERLAQRKIQHCVYHGGLTDEEREKVQNKFMDGRVPVVVATNAFGMGVDRADLRFVIHWDVPGSVEAYYQEVGRAGRDGALSICNLLYNYADVRTQEFFLEGANPEPHQVIAVLDMVRKKCKKGPVTKSISDWAKLIAEVSNDMAVRTCMGIIERSGFINREKLPGERIYTIHIDPEGSSEKLNSMMDSLALKRQRDEQKLKTLLKYVDTRSCRHAFLLNYFGETDHPTSCDVCDRCVSLNEGDVRPPTEKEWVVLQKILSCVARMRGRFGVIRVVQVLTGSTAQPVLDNQLNQLPTYGTLKDRTSSDVRIIIDELIRIGALRITTGDYPLLEITEHGLEMVHRNVTPSIKWPTHVEKTAKQPKGKTTRHTAKGITQLQEGEYDEGIYNELRAWRMRLAKARHVQPFVILSNRTLQFIARSQPTTYSELEDIPGIGPAKLQQFGDDILKVIKGE